MMERVGEEEQKHFPQELGLLFYVPVIGLFCSLFYFWLVSASARKGTKGLILVVFGGIICSVLYLILVYNGVKHRRDYNILTDLAFSFEHRSDDNDLMKAAYRFYIGRPHIYIFELLIITTLSYLSYFSKKPARDLLSTKGTFLGLLCWLIVIDFFLLSLNLR